MAGISRTTRVKRLINRVRISILLVPQAGRLENSDDLWRGPGDGENCTPDRAVEISEFFVIKWKVDLFALDCPVAFIR
jgi:hypothetical protein